jgi:hypothetical protein
MTTDSGAIGVEAIDPSEGDLQEVSVGGDARERKA